MAGKRSVSIATACQRAAETRERSRAVGHPKTKNRTPTPIQSRSRGILTSTRSLKVRGRVKTSVADATFRLFLHATELPPPPGFELRLELTGEQTRGGFWHQPSGTSSEREGGRFVASWFHVLAVTKDAWLIAYVPPNCSRISSWLIPFSEAKKLPLLLRKAGCRIGSAKLLVEMMTGLVPRYTA